MSGYKKTLDVNTVNCSEFVIVILKKPYDFIVNTHVLIYSFFCVLEYYFIAILYIVLDISAKAFFSNFLGALGIL